MTYTVIVNEKFPSLNEYLSSCGRHPMKGAALKKKYMEICEWEIRRQMPRVVLKTPITLVYRFYEENKRRDKSNVASMGIKCFEDALQSVGALKNDNWSGVESWITEFYIDKENPRLEVEMTECDTE